MYGAGSLLPLQKNPEYVHLRDFPRSGMWGRRWTANLGECELNLVRPYGSPRRERWQLSDWVSSRPQGQRCFEFTRIFM